MYPNYYQNPYMNYQPCYQPNGQQMSRGGLSGRVVSDFDLITANDVPMDGKSQVILQVCKSKRVLL